MQKSLLWTSEIGSEIPFNTALFGLLVSGTSCCTGLPEWGWDFIVGEFCDSKHKETTWHQACGTGIWISPDRDRIRNRWILVHATESTYCGTDLNSRHDGWLCRRLLIHRRVQLKIVLSGFDMGPFIGKVYRCTVVLESTFKGDILA